jgi:mannose/fructose-specific phosphotransferase system component IIA
MVKAIIICHGQLAFDFFNTLQKLYGEITDIYPFSNDFIAPEVLYNNVADVLKKNNNSSFIIMVDLRGGNCWKIGKMLSTDFKGVRLISGISIPMVISYISKRDQFPLDELAKIVEKDSHRGILLE